MVPGVRVRGDGHVKETVFHAELAAAFRTAGYWVAKWPDQAVSRMVQARDGGMRFVLPKPCDLIGCEPGTGRLVAIEAKLLRARTFRVDDRMARQLETLRTLAALGACVALALNFRFTSKRPAARVNRAFLVGALEPPAWTAGARWTLEAVAAIATECPAGDGRLDVASRLALGTPAKTAGFFPSDG